MIKAIDTYYNGNYFRSRLEARWAVCFELFDIRYEYELEGFELSNGVKYLPDFYLPAFDAHVEIKPEYQFPKRVYDRDLTPNDVGCHEDFNKKWVPFSEHKTLIIVVGVPGRSSPLKLVPELYKYNETIVASIGPVLVGVEELNTLRYNKELLVKANKVRFEHLEENIPEHHPSWVVPTTKWSPVYDEGDDCF
jgi:hypothetical protein